MATKLTGPVRVRFAPSPTGFLHVGGARTAIYNDLLRQNLGGAFVLRIEDTDRQRSDAAMTEQILSSLAWVGVEWDEGPFLQSERLDRHREVAEQLIAQGKAYRSFTPAEDVDRARRAAEKAGTTFSYRRSFPALPPDEGERRAAAGEAFTVRFRMPEGDIVVDDLVKGRVVFPGDVLDDFIILRSDGSPTYNFTVVVDDSDMRIDHVVRGDDHLSNTPKQIGLYQALAAPVPVFGHLPLIMGPDGKRLSKRTGATSVEEFRDQGILPQALYNYLALLGWSPGDDRELISRAEMIEVFNVDRLGTSAATFDYDKLHWMNARYMSGLDRKAFLRELTPFLEQVGVIDPDGERLVEVVELHRTRARSLLDLAEQLVPYFRQSLDYDAEACGKFLATPQLAEMLEELIERYAALAAFDIESTEEALRQLTVEREVKAGVIIHPTRMALSCQKKGPPLFDLVVVMGREASLRHLRQFVAFLRQNAAQEESPEAS